MEGLKNQDFSSMSNSAKDLIEKMLNLNPEKRLTV